MKIQITASLLTAAFVAVCFYLCGRMAFADDKPVSVSIAIPRGKDLFMSAPMTSFPTDGRYIGYKDTRYSSKCTSECEMRDERHPEKNVIVRVYMEGDYRKADKAPLTEMLIEATKEPVVVKRADGIWEITFKQEIKP